MIQHSLNPNSHILEINIGGHIGREELSKALNEFAEPLQTWPEIRILKQVESFEGIETMAFIDDLKFAFENWSHLQSIKKIALVTDQKWVEKLSEMTKYLFSAQVAIFRVADIEQARNWLKQ